MDDGGWRMIAFRPSGAFKAGGTPSDDDDGNQQRQKRQAVERKYRNVALHRDVVGNVGMQRSDFRLDAQVILARWNAGDDDGVVSTAFRPTAITIVAGVVADLASE